MPKIYNKDKPIKSIADDLLGYKTFVQQLAGSIREINKDAKWVISLQGPWGCGKTSIINMVKNELAISSVKIIDFQPWNFKNSDQLIQQFFIVLRDAIPKGKNDEIVEKIYKAIETYSNILLCVPKVGGSLAFIIKKIAGIKSAEYDSERDNLLAQKEKIAKLLKKLDQKFLIIIDDIDRLQKSEIPLIFQLVKSIADFPNINYLLSFDKTIVVEALNNTQGVDGAEYLKKIIQIPFDVPPVNETKVVNTLNRQLTEIANHYQVDLSEHCFNNNILGETFGSLIKNLRDVNLLCNRVNFIYPPIRNLVNFEDMAKLQVLNLFVPRVYNLVKFNPAIIGCNWDAWDNGLTFFDFDKVVKDNPDMFHPFPHNFKRNSICDSIKPSRHSETLDHELRREYELYQNKRIISLERLPAYFSIDLNDVSFSEDRIHSILSCTTKDDIRKCIKDIYFDGKLISFFAMLKNCLENIDLPPEQLKFALCVILSQSEEIRNEYCKSSSFNFNDDWRNVYTSIHFFEIIKDKTVRKKLINEIISTASISLLMALSLMFSEYDISTTSIVDELWNEVKETFSARLNELPLNHELMQLTMASDSCYDTRRFGAFCFIWQKINKTGFIQFTEVLRRSCEFWHSYNNNNWIAAFILEYETNSSPENVKTFEDFERDIDTKKDKIRKIIEKWKNEYNDYEKLNQTKEK